MVAYSTPILLLFFLSVAAIPVCFVLFLFRSGRRKFWLKGVGLSAVSTVVMMFFVAGVQIEREARAEGWESSDEKSVAAEYGILEADVWKQQGANLIAASEAEKVEAERRGEAERAELARVAAEKAAAEQAAEAKRIAAEAAAEEEAKRTAEAARAAERAEDERKGFHCLSGWDGSHRKFTRLVEANLRDPDSFDHMETRVTPVNAEGYHTIQMTYRARNGFGGMNVGTAFGTYANDDCEEVLVISFE